MKRGTVWAALLFATNMATAEDCKVTAVTLSSSLVRSQWQEFSASEQMLLEEKGTLNAHQLGSHALCLGAEWQMQWGQAQGQRRYVGLTNKKQAATTTTDIQDQFFKVDALIPFGAFWFVDIGLERRTTDRNIQSTEQAAGYPESFKQLTGLAGLRYRMPFGDDSTLDASMRMGRPFHGQVWLDLPNADPALLSLGKGRVTEAKLMWTQKMSAHPGWLWGTSLHWRRTTTAASNATALIKNDRLVGTATQPRTHTQSLGLNATIGYEF